jgi:hypothetical protein
MTTEPSKYWVGVGGHESTHPADRPVLNRSKHSFETRALPNPFFGPLATVPVVLLFLNPGLREYDIESADSPNAQAYFHRQRSGQAALPASDE